jgi:hypothetical protein
MSVKDQAQISRTALGKGIAKFLRKREGIFAVALEVRGLSRVVESATARGVLIHGPYVQKVPVETGRSLKLQSAFLGMQMPWLIEYDTQRQWQGDYVLRGVEINVSSLGEMVEHYCKAYSVKQVERLDSNRAQLHLDRGWLILSERNPEGFDAVFVSGNDTDYCIRWIDSEMMIIPISHWLM